ncbi:nitroreductase family protein [Hymenobacter sp.]|uniref:nitroreductase family protein n=1 Tax=Hymenobacter sp. TaxID=1898978 RepID=UPI00286B48BF|nr:nitroreductase family protein [Hymenobacter sp.]
METLSLDAALKWRYATKRMTGAVVPAPEVDRILAAIRPAPTSRGLQPFKVLVIEDPTLKQAISPLAEQQPQVVESSHLLVFAAWSAVTREQVDEYIQRTAQERGVPVERLSAVRNVLEHDQLTMDDETFHHWAAKQVYIALGFALTTAAVHQIDAAALEGFNPAQLDELLHLRQRSLRSVVLLALGYRDVENDWMLKLKKVRRPPEELFVYLPAGELSTPAPARSEAT